MRALRSFARFIAACVAKMMPATLTLLSVEGDLIALDAPIVEYLPPDITTGLHVHDGVDYSAEVTPRRLLQHTGGLADHWFDERDPACPAPSNCRMIVYPKRYRLF